MNVSQELKTMYNTLGEGGVVMTLLSEPKGVPPINLHNVTEVAYLLFSSTRTRNYTYEQKRAYAPN